MNTTTCRSFPRALSPGGYLNALLPNSARYSSRTAIVKTGKSTCAAFFAVAAAPGNHNETYDDDGHIEAVIAAATITLRANYQASVAQTRSRKCATPRWTVAASGERRFAVGLTAENESTPGDTERADAYKMRLWRCCPRK
jgi:hypothetical protein